MKTVEVELGGSALHLHASGAAFQPSSGRLFVADLHLGKGGALRAGGVALPRGTSAETMERVSAAARELSPTEIWVLGDLVHARSGIDERLAADVAHWMQKLPGHRLNLVEGNHDRGAGRLPESWPVVPHEDPTRLEGLHLHHIPPLRPDAPALAGHLHPMVRVGRGRTRTRKLPAFMGLRDDSDSLQSLVLPAMGRLVDGAVVRWQPGRIAWACVDGSVMPLPERAW